MEAVGQLTGGVAHDFNNLLTVILGNLDLLREEPELAPRAREMADLAIRASLRGADLTRQLLAFSRRQSLASKVIGLADLVNGNEQPLRPLGSKARRGRRGLAVVIQDVIVTL